MEKRTEELMAMASEVNGYNGSLEHLSFYSMEELDYVLAEYEPYSILCKMHFGDFNPMHEYFRFDAYANLESFSDWGLEEELQDYEDEIMEEYSRMEEEG